MTKNFLWGTATSAHQVEGQNSSNDWWAWEQARKVREPSGNACDHYHRFKEDFQIISSLGHNAHRLSIEWSRLEPREGEWDEAAFRHYEEVFRELNRLGITPILTLHHFTNPVWFNDKGGWLHPKSPLFFERFVKKVVASYSQYVQYWITFNEPLIYTFFGYVEGTWAPGLKSVKKSTRVIYHLLQAHVLAYQAIHREDKTDSMKVSIAKHMTYFAPWNPISFMDQLSVSFRNWFFNDLFIEVLDTGFLFFPGIFNEFLPQSRTLDFIGVNYYTRNFIRFRGLSIAKLLGAPEDAKFHNHEIKEKNFLGWEIYPRGLFQILLRLKKFNLPVIITENGICTENDDQRIRFIESHLNAVDHAIGQGVNIQGFFYWSLMDNFEWADGFAPRFGLVQIDYTTQRRSLRNSAQIFSNCCRKLIQEMEHGSKGFI